MFWSNAPAISPTSTPVNSVTFGTLGASTDTVLSPVSSSTTSLKVQSCTRRPSEGSFNAMPPISQSMNLSSTDSVLTGTSKPPMCEGVAGVLSGIISSPC